MDNSKDLPGYKYYVDPASGERPAVFVAFLDLVRDDASTVTGVVFEVDDARLQELDSRERNYERRDVETDPPTGGPTYAYVGTPEARERFRTGPTVVARAYFELVQTGFERLGAGPTDAPPVPIRDLERVDIRPS
jgi:gamma-glutamyl AIG2-like cyclotransferase